MHQAPKPPSLYFVNPAADWLLVGGGSIAAFFLLKWFGPATRSPDVIAAAGAFSWVCNWPHFSATLWRLYHSQENIRRFPITALLIPPVVLAGAAASFAFPETVAPAFVKLFLLWSPYHFSGQTVGISLVYAKRAGLEIGRLERLALSGFVFGTYISSTARAEVGLTPLNYFSIQVPTLGLPQWVATAATWSMWLCGLGFLALVARWCLTRRQAVAPIVLVPATAQLFWFILGSRVPAFYEFVPAFHGLQYLLVAWTMHVREKTEAALDSSRGTAARRTAVGQAALDSSRGTAARRTAVGQAAPASPAVDVPRLTAEWGLGNILIGATLFWGLPRLFSGVPDAGLDFSMPVVIAAVQLHHFFVDGVIWKLRDSRVGARLAAGLPRS